MADGLVLEIARGAHSLLPARVRQIALVRRRAKYWRAAGIVFVHVPKAAGTSVTDMLYGRFMGHSRAVDIRRWAPADIRKLPSFSIARNPWSRTVSAYRFAKAGKGRGEGYQAGIRNPEMYDVPEFGTFESFVKEWLTRFDVHALDGVFRPQWTFLYDDERRLLVDHLGRLEDLAPTMDYIRHAAGIDRKLPHLNFTSPDEYRTFFTPQLVNIVGDLYADDIKLLGYDF
jgi:hypothetical protein